ncbi:hypothetical protein LZ31DRAFT_156011 [Colletotrichum somersetense]|nr:hypothetical protein LZ31DRAFT_156011 [Colletotrichum somersetense]
MRLSLLGDGSSRGPFMMCLPCQHPVQSSPVPPVQFDQSRRPAVTTRRSSLASDRAPGKWKGPVLAPSPPSAVLVSRLKLYPFFLSSLPTTASLYKRRNPRETQCTLGSHPCPPSPHVQCLPQRVRGALELFPSPTTTLSASVRASQPSHRGPSYPEALSLSTPFQAHSHPPPPSPHSETFPVQYSKPIRGLTPSSSHSRHLV